MICLLTWQQAPLFPAVWVCVYVCRPINCILTKAAWPLGAQQALVIELLAI